MLVDIVERFGRESVKEVEINAREHRNRPLEELAPQAQAIIATALARAGLATPESGLHPVRERPPMLTIDEYRARFSV
jgi:glucosyl-3-phosphoglycerate synthase